MIKRPSAKNPLFVTEEKPLVIKGLSPIQRQRAADGTPYTVTSRTALRPPDPTMYIREDLAKGSLAENLKREVKPDTDPQDPSSVVKAFLAKDEDKEDFVKKSQAATARLQTAVSKLSKAVNLPDEDDEDEEKSIGSDPAKKPAAKPNAGRSTGAGVVNAAAAVPKMILGSVPKR